MIWLKNPDGSLPSPCVAPFSISLLDENVLEGMQIMSRIMGVMNRPDCGVAWLWLDDCGGLHFPRELQSW